MSTITPDTGTQTWNLDTTHSSVDFSVKHLGFFTVRGSLGPITGTAVTTDGTLSSVVLSIDVTGISTNNEQRDGHLKSADFLDVAAYPTANFQSTSILKKSDAEYTVTGDFTLKGVTKSISVDIEAVPAIKDPMGNIRAGVSGSGVIVRSEYGLTYNAVMETGHAMLSDDVKYTFDIQAITA